MMPLSPLAPPMPPVVLPNPLDKITPVTDALLDNPPASDWLIWRRTYDDYGFSPLKQINDQNVKSLGLAWYLPIDSAMGMSSEPIEVDGTVYVTAPLDIVYAVDASSGKLLWRFDPEVERGVSTQNSYAVRVNRGAAVWEGAVYVATGDCRLFAIDCASRKPRNV